MRRKLEVGLDAVLAEEGARTLSKPPLKMTARRSLGCQQNRSAWAKSEPGRCTSQGRRSDGYHLPTALLDGPRR